MNVSPHDRQTLAARAATIDERRQALVNLSTPAPRAESVPALRHWNQAFSPGDVAAFTSRLAWDAMDMAMASRIASRVDEPSMVVDAPWLEWLDRLCGEARGVLTDLDDGQPLPDSADDALPFSEILELARRAGRRALHNAVPTEAMAGLTADALGALERQLLRETARYADLALFAAFQASASSHDGPPSSASSRYRTFVRHLLSGRLVPFFLDYPVLARQIATVLARWVESSAELLTRLHEDRSAIRTTLAAGCDPGPVIHIDPALSDPHHGRRRVSALEFSSGLRIVYKPRSVAIERAFGDVLRWLNTGLDVPLRVLTVLDRGTHGWIEFAAPGALSSPADVAAYYAQAGALMCVTAALGSQDLHRENLVATNRGPVLVDLELLLQPEGAARDGEHGMAMGTDGPARLSCLSTGMLSLIDLTSEGEPHDAGGLRGATTGVLPFSRRVWKDIGMDTMHVVEESTFSTAAAHVPHLGEDAQAPAAWAGDVVSGFSQTYRVLLAHRDELMNPDGPLSVLASCTVRILPRPTNQYAMLAHLLATPKYQRSGVTASAAVDVLHRSYAGTVAYPPFWPMAVAERRAITSLDIPYFGIRADGTGGITGEGASVPADYAFSGLEAARERLSQLSFTDLAAQVALLRRALTESVESSYPTELGDTSASRAGAAGEPDSQRFVDAAEWVAHALLSRAERTAGGALTWHYRPEVGGPGWRDHHLYDGSLGPALFFTALAAVTADPHWCQVADAVRAPLRAHAARFDPEAFAGDESVGGGNGVGSVVYGCVVLAAMTGDRSWTGLAGRLAGAMKSRIDATDAFDIIDGSAGAVLALVALYEVRPERCVLDAAMAFGRRLASQQVAARRGEGCWPSADGTCLLGFAHGASGAAAALARLARVSGNRDVAAAARRGFAFVRRQFQSATGTWPLAVTADGTPVGGVMHGWCHGAPGMLLATLAAAAVRDTAPVSRAMAVAAGSVAGWRPALADHVCCGSLGRADVLLRAGEWTGRSDAVAAARALAMRVVDRAGRRGHFRLSGVGTDYRVFDPGFFQGLSGIGFTLLRMARPGTLPSVLGFDAPRATLRYCSPGAAD